MDSVQRGQEYKGHTTQNCHWRNIKRDRQNAFQQAKIQAQAPPQANSAVSDTPSSMVEPSDPFGLSSRYDSDTDSHRSGAKRRRRRNNAGSDYESEYES